MGKKYKFYAAILAALLLVQLPTPAFAPKFHAQSVEELQVQKDELRRQIEAAEADIHNLALSNEALSADLAKLKEKHNMEQALYDEWQMQVKLAGESLKAAMERQKNAAQDLINKEAEYEARMLSFFKIRQKSTLEVLLQSDSFSGFFTNMRLMAYVNSVDQSMITQLDDARQVAERARLAAEQTKEEYELFAAEKKEQLGRLEQGIALKEVDTKSLAYQIFNRSTEVEVLKTQEITTTAAIDQLYVLAQERARQAAANQAAVHAQQASIDQANASISQSIAASQQAEAEAAAASLSQAQSIAASQSEAEKQSAEQAASTATDGAGQTVESSELSTAPATSPPTTTAAPEPPPTQPPIILPGQEKMIYPLASFNYISSPFGWRPDPFGKPIGEMHWGTDFAAEAGTAVRAALSGSIEIASAPIQGSTYGQANNGFGNYVVIMTNDGMLMIYAHLKTVSVAQGGWINQGEVLGSVGSTGNSTGPHLHFQVKPAHVSDPGVDAMQYIN